MKRLLPWVSYLIFIPLMLFVTVACGTCSLIASLWDTSGRQQHAIAHFWAKLMLGISLSPMTVVHPERLRTGRAAVYASNHLSYMDTPALFGALPFQFRILANHYLFKIPFVGWHLTRSGQVPIDQSSMRSQVAGLMRGVKTLKEGMPLLIFPDGGRSSDGHIRQFLQGAAFMAIKAQVPLVPLVLVGTYELLPMHTYHLTPRPLMLVACEPMDTTGMTTKDAEALTQRLLDAITAEYYQHSQLVRPEAVPENQAKIPSSEL
jgi:1-acyl-sn-glycerol-3-phosphate acyltransferase